MRLTSNTLARLRSKACRSFAFKSSFYDPYFCQVQDAEFYAYAEGIPGPITERFAQLAKELKMVIILPIYEEEQPGILYNTAAVIDADDTYLMSKDFGKSSASDLEMADTQFLTQLSARSASTFDMTGTSPKGGGHLASTAPRSCLTTLRHRVVCLTIYGASSSRWLPMPMSTTSERSIA